MLRVTSLPASAQTEFTTNFDTTYQISKTGSAQVTKKITLTNNFSQIYATSYGLSLEGKKPENVKATQGKTNLPVEVKDEEGKYNIMVSFPEAVVGKGKAREFTISYTIQNLALQNGQVWELNIPRIGTSENFSTYNVTIHAPKTFGELAYISPEPKTRDESGNEYVFTYEKDEIVKAGVVAAFGNFQVFEFALNYHLQNPYQDKTGKTEIALIPDTAFQRVYYNSLDPKPKEIYLDEDGNWLGTFLLKPSQQLDITTRGAVQLFSTPQTHYPKIPPQNIHLSQTQYWQTQDPKIALKAQGLKTPKNIYNYVVETLDYDYNRVSENAERLGAQKALDNPKSAVCMEFTDLFVAISRAAGIPAREINGFAYTENPEIQPLSLVADILHAWPEYWDSDKNIWKPADPTWGKTTGGVDFFDKFDLAHITFAIHGYSSDSPAAAGSYKLALSPERDVSISFGKLPNQKESQAKVTITPVKSWLPIIKNKLKVVIENPGPTALYKQDVKIRTFGGVALKDTQNEHLNFLAPFDSRQFAVYYSLPFAFINSSSKIQILVGDTTASYEIPLARVHLYQAALIFNLLLALVGAGFGIRYAIKKIQSHDKQPTIKDSTNS